MMENRTDSKPLSKADISGENLSIRALAGDYTYAINFDRLQFHQRLKRYIIFEYQKCEAIQCERGITPWTSHPNRYWNKCKRKYFALWKAARKLDATLYVVNYAEPDTFYQNQIRLIRVTDMGPDGLEPNDGKNITFQSFSDWFRKMNEECR